MKPLHIKFPASRQQPLHRRLMVPRRDVALKQAVAQLPEQDIVGRRCAKLLHRSARTHQMEQIDVEPNLVRTLDGRNQIQSFCQRPHGRPREKLQHHPQLKFVSQRAKRRKLFQATLRFAIVNKRVGKSGTQKSRALQPPPEIIRFGPARQGKGIGNIQPDPTPLQYRAQFSFGFRTVVQTELRHSRQRRHRCHE